MRPGSPLSDSDIYIYIYIYIRPTVLPSGAGERHGGPPTVSVWTVRYSALDRRWRLSLISSETVGRLPEPYLPTMKLTEATRRPAPRRRIVACEIRITGWTTQVSVCVCVCVWRSRRPRQLPNWFHQFDADGAATSSINPPTGRRSYDLYRPVTRQRPIVRLSDLIGHSLRRKPIAVNYERTGARPQNSMWGTPVLVAPS